MFKEVFKLKRNRSSEQKRKKRVRGENFLGTGWIYLRVSIFKSNKHVYGSSN